MSNPCATDGNRKGRGESGHQPGEDLEPGAIWLLTLAAEAEGHTAGLNLGSVWYNEISVDLCVVVIPGFVWSPAFFFFQVLPQSTSFTIIDVRRGGEEFFKRIGGEWGTSGCFIPSGCRCQWKGVDCL